MSMLSMFSFRKTIYLFVMFVLSFKCYAGIEWNDSSLTLLRGNNFETGDKERLILTIR